MSPELEAALAEMKAERGAGSWALAWNMEIDRQHQRPDVVVAELSDARH